MSSVRRKTSIPKQRVSLTVKRNLRSNYGLSTGHSSVANTGSDVDRIRDQHNCITDHELLSNKPGVSPLKTQNKEEDYYLPMFNDDTQQHYDSDQASITSVPGGLMFPDTPQNIQENMDSTPATNYSEIKDKDSLHCYSGCQLRRRYKPSMIRCHVCMILFHIKCSDATNLQSIWTCDKCRSLPNTVSILTEQLSELQNVLSNLISKQDDFYSNICEISANNFKLLEENKQLKKKLYEYRINAYNELTSSESSSDSVSSEQETSDDDEGPFTVITTRRNKKKRSNQNCKSRNKTDRSKTIQSENVETTPKNVKSSKPKATIVGDSIIRGSGNKLSSVINSFDTCVLSTSGYTVNDAAANISEIAENHSHKDIIIFQIGTNDVIHSDHLHLMGKYEKMIKNTKSAAPDCNVVLTAVPNRITMNSNWLNKKIDNLNRSLHSLCEKVDRCWYINCNPKPLRRNYKYDGFHLSRIGLNEFSIALGKFINANFHSRVSIKMF